MLSSQEQMDIIKAAIERKYQGPIYELIEQAMVQRQLQMQAKQKQQQGNAPLQPVSLGSIDTKEQEPTSTERNIIMPGQYQDGGVKENKENLVMRRVGYGVKPATTQLDKDMENVRKAINQDKQDPYESVTSYLESTDRNLDYTNKVMGYISQHESDNMPDQKQISGNATDGFYDGPGRGLFQYEVGEYKSANTAVNRFGQLSKDKFGIDFEQDDLNSHTDFYDIKNLYKQTSSDFSTLEPNTQKALFLADQMYGDSSDDFNALVSNNRSNAPTQEEIFNYWGIHHKKTFKVGDTSYSFDELPKEYKDREFKKFKERTKIVSDRYDQPNPYKKGGYRSLKYRKENGGFKFTMSKEANINCGPGTGVRCSSDEAHLKLKPSAGFTYDSANNIGATSSLNADIYFGATDQRQYVAPTLTVGATGEVNAKLTNDNPNIKPNYSLMGTAKLGMKERNRDMHADWMPMDRGHEYGVYGNYDLQNKNIKDVGIYGSYGIFEGNVGYDLQDKMVKAGLGIKFGKRKKGGFYKNGGEDEEYGNLINEVEVKGKLSRRQKLKNFYKKYSGKAHTALDVAGLFPGLGIIPDAINTAWYALEGDKTNTALSAAAMVPFAGQAVTVGKLGKKAIQFNRVRKSKKIKDSDFKSEIDWGKWNKEIPKDKKLMDEYKHIEEVTKDRGTFMKNTDGTDFKGTKEQFVQQKSKNFKLAYGDNPIGVTYRGTYSPTFKPFKEIGSVFTANRVGAAKYGMSNRIFKGADDPTRRGILELYYPKSKNILNIDAGGRGFKTLPTKTTEGLDIPRISYKNQYGELRISPKGTRSTDDIARFLETDKRGFDYANIKNVFDGSRMDDLIYSNKPGRFLKSTYGNRGTFDLSNPDLFKKKGGFKSKKRKCRYGCW